MNLRTYLTLEIALTRRLQKAWLKKSAPIYSEISEALQNEDWALARRIVPELDMTSIGDTNREYIKYVLLSLAVFGAGMASKESPSFLATGTHDALLNKVTNTFLLYLKHNATTDVQEQALQSIANAEPVQKGEGNTHHDKATGEFTSVDGGRANLAKKSFNPASQVKQAIANQSEIDTAAATGIPRTPDNSAFDLVSKTVCVEVKTLIDKKSDQITIHPESLVRKRKEAKKTHRNSYTVVIDKRDGKQDVYWREGVGSFWLQTMNKVKSLQSLKKVLV